MTAAKVERVAREMWDMLGLCQFDQLSKSDQHRARGLARWHLREIARAERRVLKSRLVATEFTFTSSATTPASPVTVKVAKSKKGRKR